MMKSNRAAIQWTVGKLVNIVLLVVLLAVSVAILPQKISTLQEQGGSFLDKVQLLLGRNHSPSPCSDGKAGEDIGGMLGTMRVCAGNCSFDLGGDTLLGANVFYLTDKGYKTKIKGLEHLIPVSSWSEDAETSEKHREAYLELKNVFEDWYIEYKNSHGDDISESEFYGILGFDPGAYFQVFLDSGDIEVKFYFDGETWHRVSRGFDVKKENENDVFGEIWNQYDRYGYSVTWNYMGDAVRRVPITGMVDYSQTRYDAVQFSKWLTNKTNWVKIEDNGVDEFRLEIGERPGVDRYVFKDGRWKKNRILWFNKNANEDAIFDEIIDANNNMDKIVWRFDTDSKREWHVPVDDSLIIPRDYFQTPLNNWFVSTKNIYVINVNKQEDLLGDNGLERFFSDNNPTVDFDGVIYDVFPENYVDSDTGVSRIIFYFVDDSGHKYGMYYNGNEFVLTYGDEYKDSFVQDSLSLDGSDWQEFLKINKIYEGLRYKC